MIRVLLILVVLMLVGMGTQAYYLAKQSAEIDRLNTEFHAVDDDEHEESHVLVSTMGNLQRYFGKAWFAGKAENWELAHFYVHEMEEAMEELIDAELVHDDKPISSLMKDMAWDQLEALEEQSEDGNVAGFNEAYTSMLNSCNNCHVVTGHSFIQITYPTHSPLDNQVFENQP